MTVIKSTFVRLIRGLVDRLRQPAVTRGIDCARRLCGTDRRTASAASHAVIIDFARELVRRERH